MMVDRKILALALAIVAMVAASVASAFALGILPPKAPGMYVTITPAGLKGGIPRNAYVVVQVSMVTPDGPMKVVYRGRLKGATLFIPYDKVAGIASKWVKEGHVTPGMMIDYWVVGENGKLIASGTTMVNYDPSELIKSKILSMQATVTVTKEQPEQEGNTSTTLNASQPAIKATRSIQPEDQRSFTWYEWRRTLYVAPENYTRSRYIKLPILILYNSMYSSTSIRVETDIASSYKVRFSMVVAIGFNIESKAKTHGASYVIPELTYKIVGNSVIILNKLGGEDMDVPSGKMGYIWIMARPVAEYQKEWKCTAGAMGYTTCQLTGKERVLEYVDEVKAYPSGRLVMGHVVDYPQRLQWPVRGFSEQLENLLSRVNLERVRISGDPFLADGKLDPGENLPLGFLFPAVQYVATDEEFVMPVGAAVAAMLVAVGGEGFAWLAPILATFSATATYEAGGTFFFMGKILNTGSSPVAVYAGVTGLECRVGSQSTRMPVLYLETVPP